MISVGGGLPRAGPAWRLGKECQLANVLVSVCSWRRPLPIRLPHRLAATACLVAFVASGTDDDGEAVSGVMQGATPQHRHCQQPDNGDYGATSIGEHGASYAATLAAAADGMAYR